MARKKTTTAAKKTTRRGVSTQHAKAGRLGGLAPHVCRGGECVKMRREEIEKGRAKKTRTVKKSSEKTCC